MTRPETIHHREEVMGTVVTLDLYQPGGIDPDAVLGPVRAAVAELHEADRIFSLWRDGTPMSRLRRGEVTLGESPPEIAEVLAACHHAREASGGWFDPWSMPDGLDPTGLVKGWAAERALDHLRGCGLLGAMVNAGGDLATFGGPAEGEPFRIAVVSPANRHEIACVVEVEGALATSGEYERGAHLIDPFTGVAHSAVASASVTGPDLATCDALATALCVGGAPVEARIDALAGYAWMTIDSEGAMRHSGRFPLAHSGAEGRR